MEQTRVLFAGLRIWSTRRRAIFACDNGAEPRESAYGWIAAQRAIKAQRRMSRVSKRSAGYRERSERAQSSPPVYTVFHL